ncbi:cytochrome c3 family protein [Candidatus Poribacteria bacterium]|nr:cytochrome c3 family protein [Candidatus Poribacteria bacterium]
MMGHSASGVGRTTRLLTLGICLMAFLATCVIASHASSAEVSIAPGQSCVGPNCHDQLGKEKHVHPPMEGGECSSCHEQQGEAHAFRLPAEGNEFCYSCHERFGQKKNQHAALEMGCLTCHDPHQSKLERLLRGDSMQSLCFSCHDAAIINQRQAHGPTAAGKCASCHNPHESDSRKLLAQPLPDLCFKCHDKPMQTAAGPIKNIKSWMEANFHPHGPLAEGDCTSCHNPHGSANFRILKASFPAGFYESFTEESYELCFSCHDRRSVLYEETTELTGFRDGPRNLHYLHVNKPLKGRKCTACHNVHASDNPEHVRQKTKFGAWELPIRFEKTQTGGSCSSGCHKRAAYDRQASGAVGQH